MIYFFIITYIVTIISLSLYSIKVKEKYNILFDVDVEFLSMVVLPLGLYSLYKTFRYIKDENKRIEALKDEITTKWLKDDRIVFDYLVYYKEDCKYDSTSRGIFKSSYPTGIICEVEFRYEKELRIIPFDRVQINYSLEQRRKRFEDALLEEKKEIEQLYLQSYIEESNLN